MPALLAALLCGCLQTKDELAIEPDGSGRVRLEIRTGIPAELWETVNPWAEGGDPSYPPLSAREAALLFPEPGFAVNVKDEPGEAGRLLVIDAVFKDVQALLASPYARAHALSLETRDGKLELKALSGMEAAARVAEVKDTDGAMGAEYAGLAGLKKKAGEMRSEFRVTLPLPADRANGARDGRAVTWIEERAKHADADAYAGKLGAVLEASCPAGGFPAISNPPRRLALMRFSDFPPGSTGAGGSAPDAGQVAAAARFVPHTLRVTRSLDLTGDGAENHAILAGALVLPRELAPARWGDVQITEVIDAQGNNLKWEQNERGMIQSFRGLDVEAEPDRDAAPARVEAREVSKSITLQFHPPEWQVKEIRHLKASVQLHYTGGRRHVIKLTNAVPPSWIRDAAKVHEAIFDHDSARRFPDATLAGLNLGLSLQLAMAQPAFTLLMLQAEGKTATIAEAQVFDANGRPWPTRFHQETGDNASCRIGVAGRPAPPLSLVLTVDASGAGVTVPILLEKLPVVPNQTK